MTVSLTYGVPTDRSGVAIRFGVERGFFREEGIDLTVRTVFGGPEIAAEYDRGILPIGELGSPPGITAIAKGHNFRIIGGGNPQGGGMFFLVRSELEDWADLKGKTVASLSIGSCSYWYLRQLLQQHGLDPDQDVTIRGLGPDYARQLELFRTGEIAALLSAEPNGALGEAQGIVRSWGAVYELGELPKLQWIIQVANVAFQEKEPDLVQAVQRAARHASAYLIDHPDEWTDFVARYFSIPREVAAVAVERERPFWDASGAIDATGLRQAISLQFTLGAIPTELPLETFLAKQRLLKAA